MHYTYLDKYKKILANWKPIGNVEKNKFRLNEDTKVIDKNNPKIKETYELIGHRFDSLKEEVLNLVDAGKVREAEEVLEDNWTQIRTAIWNYADAVYDANQKHMNVTETDSENMIDNIFNMSIKEIDKKTPKGEELKKILSQYVKGEINHVTLESGLNALDKEALKKLYAEVMQTIYN